MASTVKPIGSGINGWEVTLSTSGNDDVTLGDIGSRAGSWIIKLVPGAGSPSTITPKTRVRGSGLTGASLDATIYYDSEGNTIAAGTASSSDKTYIVPSDGCDVILSVVAGANGGTAWCTPVIGA